MPRQQLHVNNLDRKDTGKLSASFKAHIACCSLGWFTCVGLTIAVWCFFSCRAVHFLRITEAPGCWSRRLAGRMVRRFRGFRSSMFAMMLSSDLMPMSSCARSSKGFTQRGAVPSASLSLQFSGTVVTCACVLLLALAFCHATQQKPRTPHLVLAASHIPCVHFIVFSV